MQVQLQTQTVTYTCQMLTSKAAAAVVQGLLPRLPPRAQARTRPRLCGVVAHPAYIQPSFHFGQSVARVMDARGSGTIIFTGATASMRGGARFAAFAGSKMALRGLAQSMARELGPRGIHVCH